MRKKIFFAAGGTGGHIFSAITLVNFYRDLDYEIFLGTDERGEKYFKNTLGIKLYKINLRFITKIFFIKKLFFYLKLMLATIKSLLIIKSIKPHLIIGFGGYVAFPYCVVSKIKTQH